MMMMMAMGISLLSITRGVGGGEAFDILVFSKSKLLPLFPLTSLPTKSLRKNTSLFLVLLQ